MALMLLKLTKDCLFLAPDLSSQLVTKNLRAVGVSTCITSIHYVSFKLCASYCNLIVLKLFLVHTTEHSLRGHSDTVAAFYTKGLKGQLKGFQEGFQKRVVKVSRILVVLKKAARNENASCSKNG